jgi:sugar/nucleoside kinase (ribokinase family)
MGTATDTDLACFGYLAYAQVFGVAAYPAANSGAQVTQIIPSLAGDAPIAALTARQLGLHVSLISNPVSLDPAGLAVLHTLDTIGVAHQAVPVAMAGLGTPQLTIITDDAGTRTWFAWLGIAIDQLNSADPTPLVTARLAHVDCYRVIDPASAAAISACRAPLLLNLGGDPLSEAVAAAASDRHVAFVQTNLDEADADEAETLAAQLHERIAADAVVITLGRFGAFARTATGTIRASAPSTAIRHTHGAGAAFSGGLAHAHLRGAGLAEALQAACTVATAHCAAANHIPRQRLHADLIKEHLS